MILQPLFGLIHHLRFRKVQKRTIWTWIHMWYGRTLIILGIINGGLGLRLAHITTPVGGKIAYGVVAGISGLAFLGLIVWPKVGKTKDSTKKPSEVPLTPQIGEDSLVKSGA